MTQTTTTNRIARDSHVSILIDQASATWGAGDPMSYYLDCLVEPDGSVLVWDEIADHYTRWHTLSPAQESRARALAGCGTVCERQED